MLYTRDSILSDVLSKICSLTFMSFPLTVRVRATVTVAESSISEPAASCSIIVRPCFFTMELSLSIRVYGPSQSTHNVSHGFVMTFLGGILPPFTSLIHQTLLQLSSTKDSHIPFQYIVVLIVSLRRMYPGCCK